MFNLVWAMWGLAGAFVYAAPKFLISLSAPILTRQLTMIAIGQLVIALSFGPIMSAGLGPWLASYINFTKPEQLSAVALITGMVANVLAPAIVSSASAEILKRIGSIFGGSEK